MPTRYRPPARLKLGHAEAILTADETAFDVDRTEAWDAAREEATGNCLI